MSLTYLQCLIGFKIVERSQLNIEAETPDQGH